YFVEGFQPRLNDDHRATHVTWFVRRRRIALHYYPDVPRHAASHGCVRLASEHAAQLIHDNSMEHGTRVIVGGIWTRPTWQWPNPHHRAHGHGHMRTDSASLTPEGHSSDTASPP